MKSLFTVALIATAAQALTLNQAPKDKKLFNFVYFKSQLILYSHDIE